eukprot:gnl/MRDRNA2_/MRDRNA2_34472_c0_seq1.p1 gnl/MRDRNA2_/MRDRNA2_34472_c0~~gnl/MRDRNA2_/MRDRNA2_34472_c0_seq1.p1  ORF type:complete len:505 (+),score=92.02 gnl/MRDRNA2_/MRDRNA2_34472_c0_seq1:68-1582(+)
MISSAGLYSLLFGVVSIVEAQNMSCDVAAVGGGWSGVYFAYRYYLDGNVEPKNICLFEASQRIGGRTYSKEFDMNGEKIVLDLGAYRFSPDMHLPGDVILKQLKLPTACYEPDCEPANKDFPPPFIFNYSAPLQRIIDPVTKLPAGYATALEAMVKKMADDGAHIQLGAELVDIQKAKDGANLLFKDGSIVQAGTVLLNLPRTPLLSLPTVQSSVGNRTLKMLQCVKFDHPANFFTNMSFGDALTKAYAYYDDAWWVNSDTLNMTEGQWPANAFQAIKTSVGVLIGIHFNDGPVICDAPGKGCRGFLEVYYSVDQESFYASLRSGPNEPFGELNASRSSEDQEKLLKVHHAVMEATGPLFTEKRIMQPHAPPSYLAVGVWSRQGQGYTAPTKVYYSKSSGDSMEKACGVEGLTEQEYRDSVLTPFKEQMPRVHVANNDWVASEVEKMYGDWAEESLLQAERALHVLNVPKPDWLDTSYYNDRVVAFAPKQAKSLSMETQPEIVV